MNLRTWQILGYLLGLFFAMEPSYIHPDEHFQGMEIMMMKIAGIKGTTAWEFEPQNAARSFGPLYIAYGPLLYANKYFLHLDSGQSLMYLLRLQNYLVFAFISKLALQFLSSSKLERSKAGFYISTSYIVWTYQSHLFSNSLETIALLVVLSLFQTLIQDSRDKQFYHYKTCIALGLVVAFGFFNRITFLAFIVLPIIPTFNAFFLHHFKSLMVCAISFISACAFFIYVDTTLYGTNDWCVAPMNNLAYNLKNSNLAEHGLHPRYTHLLLNVPQMLGPLLIFFVSRRQRINLSFLACISGIIVLSMFQHQELRFLIPLLPLFCVSVDLSNFDKFVSSQLVNKAWLAFNVIFGVIMGSLHQRGVVTVIEELARPGEKIGVNLWWKTYSPPTWMYMNCNLTVSTTSFVNGVESLKDVDFGNTVNHVIDLKGCDYDLFELAIINFLHSSADVVKLISPKSVSQKIQRFKDMHPEIRLEVSWESVLNLDLDHIDLSEPSTLRPGMVIYDIQLI